MRPVAFALALAACLAGCAAPAAPTAVPPAGPTPMAAPAPTATALPQAAQVRVTLGQPELVFDYSAQTCRRAQGFDLPDLPAHAVRATENEILIIFSGPPYNFALRGPDFDHLSHDCTPSLITTDSPDAFTFDNQEWLFSPYREGDTIHALVHNEYHDPRAQNCLPGVTSPENPCWYNAITYASSSDGGRTFQQPQAPGQLVAAAPHTWDPLAIAGRMRRPNPYGYMGPSNIVRGPDGAYYALFRSLPDPLGQVPGGTCLMRTESLADPASWRAWDGTAFGLAMPSPFDAQGAPRETGLLACAPVSPDVLGELNDSLTFNTYLGQYIVLGAAVRDWQGSLTCGTFFSLSSDLVNWSEPQLLMPGKLPFPPCNQPDDTPNGSVLYPSLIDHEDASLNFEISGRNAYLYYEIWNEGLDRDLWRVPVTFSIAATHVTYRSLSRSRFHIVDN